MKCWKTMPMPTSIASVGDLNTPLLAVDADLAVVGLLHAVEDLHQRRLAGAVLPDEGVDGARADGEVDVVVGDDAREALADARQDDLGGVDVLGRGRVRGLPRRPPVSGRGPVMRPAREQVTPGPDGVR